MAKDSFFNFDEGLNSGFDKQLEKVSNEDKEKQLKKALVLCLRNKFAEALKIYEGLVEDDIDYIPAYIGILRVHSQNFKKFDGEEIEADLNIIDELGDGSEADDENYMNYLAARANYLGKGNKKVETNSLPVGILTKEETEKKYKDKKYSEVVESIKYYADLNDKDNLFRLGYLYNNGLGVPQNYSKAKEYYEKAADLGNTVAIRCLGDLYFNGKGVPQNNTKAKEYYEKALALGDKEALEDLGWSSENLDESLDFFEKAINNGIDAWWGIAYVCSLILETFNLSEYEHDYDYYFNKMYDNCMKCGDLGLCRLGEYYEYIAETPDLNKAYTYYKKAADMGNEDAKKALKERFNK